jgi:hypothetical protein
MVWKDDAGEATILPSVEERAEEARLVLEHAPDDECRRVWQHIVSGYDVLIRRAQ